MIAITSIALGLAIMFVAGTRPLYLSGACLLMGLGLSLRLPAMQRYIHPIYVRLGILPEGGPRDLKGPNTMQ